jgi:type IV pilus assembly protein PilE
LDAVEGNRYKVLLNSADGATYKLTAQRLNPGGNATDKCGDFTLNQAGVRNVTGGLSVIDCWGR